MRRRYFLLSLQWCDQGKERRSRPLLQFRQRQYIFARTAVSSDFSTANTTSRTTTTATGVGGKEWIESQCLAPKLRFNNTVFRFRQYRIAFLQDACTWEGPHTTCIEAGCKCSTNNNSCDRKHYCSGICAVLENHLNTDMVDGCFVPGERHTGQPVISLFSKGKPGLTEPLRSALEERLLAKSEYANPGLVDSLMYVLDMVQAAYPPYSENGRRRRSRSVGTRSRTVHRTRCKSLARLPVPVRGKQKGVEKKKPVPSVNVEDSTRRKFRP